MDGLYVGEGFASAKCVKATHPEEGHASGSSHHLIQGDRVSTEGSNKSSVHPEQHQFSVRPLTSGRVCQ